MITRRSLLSSISGIAHGMVFLSRKARAANVALRDIPMVAHELAMQAAIAEARRNPVYPFGAVITSTTGEVLAKGVNSDQVSPTLHGEIVCMNDYVTRYGNKGWEANFLYTTGEPCPMCMSALVWAGIGGVVFASSIDVIRRAGIEQIGISAKQVVDASPFFKGDLLGGVLQAEADKIFLQRNRP